MKIELLITGNPVSWLAHKGYGRRAYNPRYVEKRDIQYQVRKQFSEDPITGPVKVSYNFYLKIPVGTSSKKLQNMEDQLIKHIKKPDCSNLVKMMEDCIKGVVFIDDSQVIENIATKAYSREPRTIIQVESVD